MLWKLFLLLVILALGGIGLAIYWSRKPRYTKDAKESLNPYEGKDIRVMAYRLGLKK